MPMTVRMRRLHLSRSPERCTGPYDTRARCRDSSSPAASARGPTIDDGTWTVGIDFAAGKYRTTATVGSSCYWGIYKSGTNGDEIIANDIPGGGRPTVTLKAGQDFKTQRCGTWEKIG